MRAAGFVLTGGNSARMGRDKALLPLHSGRLVHKIATTLSTVVDSVTLVGQPQRYTDLPWECLPDLRPGLGPLAGIETALTASTNECNLIVACDMPGLRADWLGALLRAAESTDGMCLVTRDREGTVHPLCAVYRRRCLPYFVCALDEQRLRLTALVESLEADYLQADAVLENVNTPLEWNEWQAASAEHAANEWAAAPRQLER